VHSAYIRVCRRIPSKASLIPFSIRSRVQMAGSMLKGSSGWGWHWRESKRIGVRGWICQSSDWHGSDVKMSHLRHGSGFESNVIHFGWYPQTFRSVVNMGTPVTTTWAPTGSKPRHNVVELVAMVLLVHEEKKMMKGCSSLQNELRERERVRLLGD